jgi:DNA replication factor GINS
MNLDELRTVQMKERKKDSLQHLRDSFYADVATYIEELKARRSRAADQADDPFSSPEVRRLSDEIETAEEVAEAVYERRVGKVVKLASFAAADMPVDQEGMTSEERRLFEDLVDRIEQNKTAVLDTLAGKHAESEAEGGSSPTGTATPDEPKPADSATAASADERATTGGESPESEGGGVLADAMGGDDPSGTTAGPTTDETTRTSGTVDDGSQGRPIPPDGPPADGAASGGGSGTPDADVPADDGDRSAGDAGAGVTDDTGPTVGADAGTDTDRTTVRITREVGEIFGVDEREYDLSTEDVVTLPSANAEPLLERDAAERID